MFKLDVLQPWPLNDAETSVVAAIAMMWLAMLALVTLPALLRLVRGVRVQSRTVALLTYRPRRHAVRGPHGRFVKAGEAPRVARSALLPHLPRRR